MQHSKPHTTLYLDDFFLIGVPIVNVMWNHWWWYYHLHLLLLWVHHCLRRYQGCYEVLWQTPAILFWNQLRYSGTINFHLQIIIDTWWLHHLWMMRNPVIKILIYMFIHFWILFSLFFQRPCCISIFNCLALIFISSNLTGSRFSNLKC